MNLTDLAPYPAPESRLTDLGLDTDDLPPEPGPAPDTDDDWPPTRASDRPEPAPVFARDWTARLHDTGVPYRAAVAWLEQHLFANRPQPPHSRSRRRDPDDIPFATRLGMARDDDESEREHLLRAGNQVPLFDQSRLTRTGAAMADRGNPVLDFVNLAAGRRPQSWFPDVTDPDATPRGLDAHAMLQSVIADSPCTPDRLDLATGPGLCPEVAARLARDPRAVVRLAIAENPGATTETLDLFAAADPSGYLDPSPHVLVAVAVRKDCPRPLLDRIAYRFADHPAYDASIHSVLSGHAYYRDH